MTVPYLDIHPEVKEALLHDYPVVALESTLISHGLPNPQNVETALQLSQEIRAQGAVPATMAIIDGRLKVGLTELDIMRLGDPEAPVIKASRRDIPYMVSTKQTGSTTVAATMILADLAQIRFFATGGIGGVHRDAATTFDISADLIELGKTSVAVVCAGAKSILDLPLTMEYLETQGVPVIGYQTDTLPAFYTTSSPVNVNIRQDTPQEIAETLKAKWHLGLAGGVVIANPIPAEHALPADEVEQMVQQALQEASAKGITGKNLTPFLLRHIHGATAGRSMKANIELLLNNARLASQIAHIFTNPDDLHPWN